MPTTGKGGGERRRHPSCVLKYKLSDWGCVPLFKMAGGKESHNLRLALGSSASSGLLSHTAFSESVVLHEGRFPDRFSPTVG